MIRKHILFLLTVKWSNSSISYNSLKHKWIKVKWFQVLLCITNSSHLFTYSSMIKQFYFKEYNSAPVQVKGFQVLRCITNNLIKHLSFVYIQQTILFQTVQLSISHLFAHSSNCSIWPIDRILSGKSGPGSDGNERVLCIPQSSSITGASPSDCFVSYLGHVTRRGFLPLCRDAVDVFHRPSLLGLW